MKLSQLNEIPKSRTMVDMFKGYNHNLRIGEGEFYDMTNLSSDNFPILSPRKNRGVYASPNYPQGLVSKDALCYVDGSDFVINKYRVPCRVPMGLTIDDEPKTLISMGAYVIIMPDKKWVNTEPKDGETSFEHGKIEETVTTTSTVTFELCKLDGEGYEDAVSQSTAPENPANMALWIDTSSVPHTLKQYSATSAMWVPIATTYIKISVDGTDDFFAPLSENDGVTISGIKDEALQDLNSTMVIWAKGYNYIVVTGILDKTTTQDEEVTIKRQMPLMDFIIEAGNRLWGCRYGVSLNGEVVNEIYASKLGDFKNWNCYAGISTDSYAVTVGSDGQFTGAITHLGYPIFFKETCMHKVYGNYPANYQVQTTACRGVQKGCERSLAIVNEILYYRSHHAVCAYDGSVPVEVSAALGDQAFGDAVAAAHGNRYYISLRHAGENRRSLFVYDTARGLWHREDALPVTHFCSCRERLYCATEDGKILVLLGEEGDEQVPWMLETGILGGSLPERNYLLKLSLRLSLDPGSRVDIYARYDSRGDWVSLGHITGRELRSFTIPLRPRRCDHLQLRLVGRGCGAIHSITKTYSRGSDV
jgi:hypothetical protein